MNKIRELLTIDSNMFFSEYYNEPFILRNGANTWPAMEKWNISFFVKKYPDLMVNVFHCLDKKWITMNLKTYFIEYYKNDKNYLYLKDWVFENDIPELLEDILKFPFFNSWFDDFKNFNKKLCWLYIGSKGTSSALHLDVGNTSAWNAVFSGQKKWVFFDSHNDRKNLYDLNIDAFNLDCEKYPNLKLTNPQYCIQNPGDIVFTPSNWIHQVVNLKSGISITENFVNQSNVDFVINQLEKEGVEDVAKELIGYKVKFNAKESKCS
jgi:histone arginine demethylase JMJD6